jgi:plastocyanin
MSRSRSILLAFLAIAVLAVSVVLSSGSANAATTTVVVDDLYYCAPQFEGGVCTTTITAGDTVVWDMSGADIAHTVTDCGASCTSPTGSPRFDSGIQEGGTFSFTFSTAGTYSYYCEVHAFEMQGAIVVQAAAPSPTLAPGETPTGGATPPAGATTVPGATPIGGGLPTTGYGNQTNASSGWWVLATLSVLGVALTSGGVLAYVRRS